MIKHINTFFYPEQSVHIYNYSKELIIDKLLEVFNRKWTLFDSNNLSGEFINKETFEICMKSTAFKTGFFGTSILVGEIKETQNGHTEITLKAKPNVGYYIWFFVCIITCLVYLYSFLLSGSIKFLAMSGLMLVVGPLLSIGISNLQIDATKERYMKYIDKKLRSI